MASTSWPCNIYWVSALVVMVKSSRVLIYRVSTKKGSFTRLWKWVKDPFFVDTLEIYFIRLAKSLCSFKIRAFSQIAKAQNY